MTPAVNDGKARWTRLLKPIAQGAVRSRLHRAMLMWSDRGGGMGVAVMQAAPDLGDGVYSLRAARRILMRSDRDMSTRRLRAWARLGLTYGTHATEFGPAVLSFADLISLEVVVRLRRAGLTSQDVRLLERRLLERFPHWTHPLAHGIFYTDGDNVWADMTAMEGAGSSEVIEVIGKRRDHYVMRPTVQPYVREVSFAEDDRRALRWELTEWVEIDPAVQFGAPVVKGTRVPVSTVDANLRAGTPEDVADWYGLTVDQVLGVKDYLSSAA